MPKKNDVLTNAQIANPLALIEALEGLKRQGLISRTQLRTALDALRPLVPCVLNVSQRTPKGIVYVSATKLSGDVVSYRISVRAKLMLDYEG